MQPFLNAKSLLKLYICFNRLFKSTPLSINRSFPKKEVRNEVFISKKSCLKIL